MYICVFLVMKDNEFALEKFDKKKTHVQFTETKKSYKNENIN